MSYFESIKNQWVYLIFDPSFPLNEPNLVMGFYPDFLKGGVKVKIIEVDEKGLWIENPELTIQNIETKESNKYLAHTLIQWKHILSIVRIPDRELPPSQNVFGFKP